MAKQDFKMLNSSKPVADSARNPADIETKVLQMRGESVFAMLANRAPKVANCACACGDKTRDIPGDKIENEVPALSEAMPIPAPSDPLQATIPNGCGCNKVANSGTSEGVFSRDMFSNAKPKAKDAKQDAEPDGDSDDNPYHETITKHGYSLSHKTDSASVYKHNELPDRFVSVKPGEAGHAWTFGKVGSAVNLTGSGAAHLDNALGAHVGKAMEKKTEGECKEKACKDKKVSNSFSVDMFKMNNSGTSEGVKKGWEKRKEDWEMSRGEFNKHSANQMIALHKEKLRDAIKGKQAAAGIKYLEPIAKGEKTDPDYDKLHRMSVSYAHASGKKVPEHVLADYPDLKNSADPYQTVSEKLSNGQELDPSDVLAMNTAIEKDFTSGQ